MVRSLRLLARLLLLALVSSWLPAAPVLPAILSATSGNDIAPVDSPPLSVAAVTDPHLPTLSLGIAVAPDPVAIGDTAALTITVSNDAPNPATNLVVTLPTPDGALAQPGPNTINPTAGWRWTVARLDGHATVDLTGSLRLVRAPAGDALVLDALATADGLASPIPGTGGAAVIDRAHGPATVRYTPGGAVILRSADGRV